MKLSRRAMLRGASVTLALPWLESWLGPTAKASEAAPPKRLVAVFFPSGTPDYWRPSQAGAGSAWQLSPILDPFLALKSRMSVLTGVENYSPAGTDPYVNPPNSRDAGMFLTCTDIDQVAQLLGPGANGVSMDQLIAKSIGQGTRLPSLVTGLSTLFSYCEERDCHYSRNISWAEQAQALPRLVDPRAVWDLMFPGAPTGAGHSPVLDKSVLDTVLASASATRVRLGRADQRRLDDYLTTVRQLELRVQAQSSSCYAPARPNSVPVPSTSANTGASTNTDSYNRGDHALLMNDLLALAVQCDMTRVVSYMLDDERSDFVYSHVKQRTFSSTGSVENSNGATCGSFFGATQAAPITTDWASITRWFSQITADLCQKLANMPEADGSVLDNTVVMYGSCMHGNDNVASNLPLALIGGRGVLVQDQHVALGTNPGTDDVALRDVYFTIMNSYFGLNLSSFGQSKLTAQNSIVSKILA